MLKLVFLILTLDNASFYEGSVAQAIELAKEQNKLLVVDVYTTWCGPCKRMDRNTFQDKRVKALFREKVIAYKIDAEKGEGIEFARKHRIYGYPSLLIINPEGEVIERRMGFIHAATLLEWVNKTLDQHANQQE